MKNRAVLVALMIFGVELPVICQGSIFSDGFESGGTCTWSVTDPLMFFYQDSDVDTFGDPNVSEQGCQASAGFVSNNGDCNDSSGETFPGAAPNDDPGLCMKDLDLDDFGDASAGPFAPGSDCDDGESAVNPWADDICDDLDNDCSGIADQDFVDGTIPYDGGPYFPDSGLVKGDQCGIGDCVGGVVVCEIGGVALTCSTLSNITAEICDGADNDCDGDLDEEGSNACGGCAVLSSEPGGPCGTCGEYECLDEDTVICNDPCTLVGFGSEPSFMHLGGTGGTVPDPLVVTFAGPPPADTFVTILSADPAIVAVVGGGTTIPQGISSAPVSLVGASLGTATLTASFAGVNLGVDVRVFSNEEPRQVIAVTPSTAWVDADTGLDMAVWLNIPAAAGNTIVDLAMTPGVFGSIPPSVDVPADEIFAAFVFNAGPNPGSELLTASIGSSNASATINVISGGRLVINEVGYDQGGNNTVEFVEIFNPRSSSVDMTNLSLVLINGNTDSEHIRINLAPAISLAPGEYLVIGSSALLATVPPTAKTIAFAMESNNLEKGAPDGIAIFDELASCLVDAISYQGEITAGVISGVGPFSLLEVVATPPADTGTGSLIRSPNGININDVSSGWTLTASVTPGAVNIP